jgi:hypothetical protein
MSDESVRRAVMNPEPLVRDLDQALDRAEAARDVHEQLARTAAELERVTAELAFVRREIARQRALYEAAMAVLEIAMSTGNAGAIEGLVAQITGSDTDKSINDPQDRNG